MLRGVRVIVIGGGLAGLVAARTLSRQNAEVVVVEARQRLGGRVWTIRNELVAPYAVEAGGEFIDGEHKAIRALARELGLELARVLREGFGLALDHDGRLKIHNTQRSIWRAFKKALKPFADRLEDMNCDWDSSVAAEIARHSLDALLRARGAPAGVRAMADALRGFFLADSTQLSALVGVELSMEDKDPGHVPIYRIRGGADQLVVGLTRGSHVRFVGGESVKAVRQNGRDVEVAMTNPRGGLDTLYADYCIVTVPPPLVLALEFSPALGDEQRRALGSLSYGPATKAILRFDTRWWRRTRRPRAFGTNLPIGAVWESAEHRGAAMLTLLAGGSASGEFQQLLASEGADGVVRRLSWLGRASALQGIEEISWEREPWSRGGYAFFSPAFDPALRDSLSRAFGRVLFAGDHTSREWQGYMEGAVRSGYRAANELLALHTLRHHLSTPAPHARRGATPIAVIRSE